MKIAQTIITADGQFQCVHNCVSIVCVHAMSALGSRFDAAGWMDMLHWTSLEKGKKRGGHVKKQKLPVITLHSPPEFPFQ